MEISLTTGVDFNPYDLGREQCRVLRPRSGLITNNGEACLFSHLSHSVLYLSIILTTSTHSPSPMLRCSLHCLPNGDASQCITKLAFSSSNAQFAPSQAAILVPNLDAICWTEVKR